MASKIDLTKWIQKHSSEIVTQYANKEITLELAMAGLLNLGLTIEEATARLGKK